MNKIEFSKGKNPYGNKVVRDNIESCLKRNIKEIFMIPAHSGVLNVVGSSPSLINYLDDLRITKSPIWAINGACNFLIKNGIIPKSQVILDSAKEMTSYLCDENIEFLIASQASKDVFDKLINKNVKVWHALVNANEEKILSKYRKDYVGIGGGCSAILRAVNLGYSQGFREFNIYGFDCSFTDETHCHKSIVKKYIENVEIIYNEKKYISQMHLVRQAKDFADMIKYFNSEIKQGNMDAINITLHGKGLAQDIALNLGLDVKH